MRKVWAVVAATFAVICIASLPLVGAPSRQEQRSAYVIIRGTTGQQAESHAPPGNWLLIRRIERP